MLKIVYSISSISSMESNSKEIQSETLNFWEDWIVRWQDWEAFSLCIYLNVIEASSVATLVYSMYMNVESVFVDSVGCCTQNSEAH